MIPQLVNRLTPRFGGDLKRVVPYVLSSDPLDLVLYMDEVWAAAGLLGQAGTGPSPPPATGSAREALRGLNRFSSIPGLDPIPPRAWEHLGYSYVLENTRAIQILRRVVREYRSGEGLGIPSLDTQRWLDATEALLFGAHNPLTAWLSVSSVRTDPEAVRRNAYWRMFGLDLAFGADDNRPPVYDKASAANSSFVRLFEELLFELWQAMSNVRNTSGANAADDDRIYRIADELKAALTSRRQGDNLAREELAAATALGWVELTLCMDTPVVSDLRAQATSATSRLRLIGERVGLAPHSQSAALFEMAPDLSLFLRTIERGVVSGPSFAWVLYLDAPPPGSGLNPPDPIGPQARRVITEWAAATGKDLKARGKPVETRSRQLVPVP
jgi:hypothetical protein